MWHDPGGGEVCHAFSNHWLPEGPPQITNRLQYFNVRTILLEALNERYIDLQEVKRDTLETAE